MSQTDKVRLAKIGDMLCRGSGYDPDDLLQEAIFRTLSGSRLCPNDVPLVTFLGRAMKSIASTYYQGLRTAPQILSMSDVAVDGKALAVASPRRNPEEHLLAVDDFATRLESIENIFKDDEEAQMVIMAQMDELEGRQICEMQNWTPKELATVQRRIRRGIERHITRGYSA